MQLQIKVGRKTPSGGNFLYAKNGEVKESIFPHSSWQNNSWVSSDGTEIPNPNWGETWLVFLQEKANISTGKKYFVALPIEFLDWDFEKKCQADQLEVIEQLIKNKPVLDKNGYMYVGEKTNKDLIYDNGEFILEVSPTGLFPIG